MTVTVIDEIQSPRLATRSELANGKWTVSLVGEGDLESIAPLGAFLARLHDATVGESAAEVLIDMHELKFINSSCLRELVV